MMDALIYLPGRGAASNSNSQVTVIMNYQIGRR